MRQRSKYIVTAAGVISMIWGISWMIVSAYQDKILLVILATFLMVLGLILLAIAFGEEK